MEREGLVMVPELHRRNALLEPLGKDRDTSKIHLSEILRVMKREAGEPVDEITGETKGYRAQLGFLLERALQIAWRDYWAVEIPSLGWQMHLERDGILGTPDGFDAAKRQLLSVKLTWKTARKWEEDFETHFRWWLAQEMGYAMMLEEGGKEPVTSALYIIGFVNGEYRGPRRLGVWTDTVRWTQGEMWDSWQSVLGYKRWIEQERGEEP